MAARDRSGDCRLSAQFGPGEATVFTYANGSWFRRDALVVPATAATFGTSDTLLLVTDDGP